MEKLIQQAEEIRVKIKNYLMLHLNEFEFVEIDSHYVTYKFGEYVLNIWTANGQDYAKFYNHFAGIDMDFDGYSDEERKVLWDKAQEAKTSGGERRNIEKTKMRNDLYFKFKGVFGDVKFTGYDDNYWWTLYKPSEIKEGDITWVLDLEKMVAIYKPLIK